MSFNFRHRFTPETIEDIFTWILTEVESFGYLSPEVVFLDGTHIKANANLHKKIKREIPKTAKIYEEQRCPHLEKCTHSKNHQKVVSIHLWNEYIEKSGDVRHTPKGKEMYKLRKETIERVFADAKEKYAMHYTPYTVVALMFRKYLKEHGKYNPGLLIIDTPLHGLPVL